jgi:hypothetical protein
MTALHISAHLQQLTSAVALITPSVWPLLDRPYAKQWDDPFYVGNHAITRSADLR